MSVSIPNTPANKDVSLTVANQATEILFSTEATKLSLYFETNAGKLSFSGTDGAAITGEITPIAAGAWFEFRLRPAGRVRPKKTARVLIAAAVVATTVHVVVEAD